ncbi:MAG: 4-hydroxy-tetrahydrodipicolinate synthase [Clostridiales bacterium]|jgi:4-hydroxy-tetrahydrodipicolinate synthase|nr:4-hydroxy-tetrahydrodipicolinate synthase [Clostridiales bacterium]
MIFQGAATALITPFSDGRVDTKALARLVNLQIAANIAALVVCGTTGEPCTMTEDERARVLDTVLRTADGRVPVIAGTGTNCTATTVEASRAAERAGADALLLVTPYYNKCTQKGLLAHYSAVAAAVRLPIVVYNVPARTGVNILPETYAALAHVPNIAAVKEASGNLPHIGEVAKAIAGRLTLYSGDDGLTHDILRLGGQGIISVASNVLPRCVSRVCALYFEGKLNEAAALHAQLQAVYRALFIEVNPIPVKAAAAHLGLCADELRLPLTEIEPGNRAVLTPLLEQAIELEKTL